MLTPHAARRLVVTALTPLEDTRRTFRLLGGVMVEKTKATILPEIESNIANVRTFHISVASAHGYPCSPPARCRA